MGKKQNKQNKTMSMMAGSSKGTGSNTMKNAMKKAMGGKKPSKLVTGHVKWFDPKRGFGFVVTEDGEEVFAHISSVKSGRTYVGFNDNDRVTFNVVPNEKGSMAKNINLVEDEEPEEEATEAIDTEEETTSEQANEKESNDQEDLATEPEEADDADEATDEADQETP